MNNKYLLSDLVTRLQKKGYDAKLSELIDLNQLVLF